MNWSELVCEKLPSLSAHLVKKLSLLRNVRRVFILILDNHGVDPALFSLNWFLCLFVDTLPVATYLHIWDALLFEGSKVIYISHYIHIN